MIFILYVVVSVGFIVWALSSDSQSIRSELNDYYLEQLIDQVDFLQEQLDELYDKVFALEDLTEVLHDDTVEEAE